MKYGMLSVRLGRSDEGGYSILFVERDRIKSVIQDEIPIAMQDCPEQLDVYFKGVRQEFS